MQIDFRRTGRFGPAEKDAGQQLGHAEGLDHIVVRPHIQGLDLFRLPVTGGDDDGGHLLGQVAELLQHLQPIHVGQPQVQEDQVRAVGEEQGQALLAAGGGDGLIVVGGEGAADKVADGVVILDDQDGAFFRHGSFPP